MVSTGQTTGQTASPQGGASIPKALGIAGMGCACLAAILSFFFEITAAPVFYLWVLALVAQFGAGIWAVARRLSR
jgi:hypothetical protein